MINEEDLVFVSFLERKYSRSGVLLSGMPNSSFRMLPTPGLNLMVELVKIRLRKVWDKKILVVMSPAHVLVPFLRMILRNKIVLDAGWPLLDGEISRLNKSNAKVKLAKSFFLDFLTFQASHAIALESNQQLFRSVKIFRLKKNRIFRSFTGFDEVASRKKSEFFECPILEICPICSRTNNQLILFRGKFNNEAGLEILAQATREIESEKLKFVIVSNLNLREMNFSNNTFIIDRYLYTNQIAHLYSAARISIGQLSSNPRLRYTIPHKAFEAAFFKTPYLTRDSIGVRELYRNDNDAIFFNPDESKLSSLIDSALADDLLSRRGSSAFSEYTSLASQNVLVNNFIENLNLILIKN